MHAPAGAWRRRRQRRLGPRRRLHLGRLWIARGHQRPECTLPGMSRGGAARRRGPVPGWAGEAARCKARRGPAAERAGPRTGGRAQRGTGAIGKIATNLRRAAPALSMGDIVRVGSRGTSRRVVEKEKDNWTGEEYRKYNESRKEAAKDVYITVGRGTRKIRLGDIAATKGRPSGKGLYIETNRGTGRRKVE